MSRSQPLKQGFAFIAELGPILRELESRPEFGVEERARWATLRERAESLTSGARDRPAPPTTPVTAPDTGDLSDLPPELLEELSGTHADPLERQILAVFQACDGSADLDQVLVGLFRKFQVVQKRRVVQNKLWRMVRKGQIDKAKNARGVFRIEASKPRPRRQGRRK